MRARFILSAAALALALFSGCSTAHPALTAVDVQLKAPESPAERAYLGLSDGASTFRLEDIRCEILVIDCFDMYCHICQTGAKHLNEMYGLAQERKLGERVKFVGLGLGDTPLEVATYKEKFKVPFPLFPDRRSVVAKQFGPVKLPNLLILRNQGGRLELINSSSGPILNPAEVLSHIQSLLGRARSLRWVDAAQAAQPTCTSSTCRKSSLSTVASERLTRQR